MDIVEAGEGFAEAGVDADGGAEFGKGLAVEDGGGGGGS